MAGFHGALSSERPGRVQTSRRVNTKKSEKEIKDEELERKFQEVMQQGLMNRDMEFTPREADSWLKTGNLWTRHHPQ